MERFCDILKSLRSSQGLTQEELSKKFVTRRPWVRVPLGAPFLKPSEIIGFSMIQRVFAYPYFLHLL